MYIPDSPDSISDEPPYEIAPSIWCGSYLSLSNHFLHTRNIKIIVNCSPTIEFLSELETSDVSLSSDIVLLSLDPSFSLENYNSNIQLQLSKQISKFNRVLQNYINHFYTLNPKLHSIIHHLFNNQPLQFESPILSGGCLQNLLFQINRLIKLLKNINTLVEVLIISKEGSGLLTTALCISYLMDSYNFNFAASLKHLQMRDPRIAPLNGNYYDDLIILESLKKFYNENIMIKESSQDLLTTNSKLKRRNDDEEMDNVVIEGKRKR